MGPSSRLGNLREPSFEALFREEGFIAKLKHKWWREERGGQGCAAEEAAAGGVSELSLENFGGIFIVLLIGILIGGLLALLEKYWLLCFKHNLMI